MTDFGAGAGRRRPDLQIDDFQSAPKPALTKDTQRLGTQIRGSDKGAGIEGPGNRKLESEFVGFR